MIRTGGQADIPLLLINGEQLITAEVAIGKRRNAKRDEAIVETGGIDYVAIYGGGVGSGGMRMGWSVYRYGKWEKSRRWSE